MDLGIQIFWLVLLFGCLLGMLWSELKLVKYIQGGLKFIFVPYGWQNLYRLHFFLAEVAISALFTWYALRKIEGIDWNIGVCILWTIFVYLFLNSYFSICCKVGNIVCNLLDYYDKNAYFILIAPLLLVIAFFSIDQTNVNWLKDAGIILYVLVFVIEYFSYHKMLIKSVLGMNNSEIKGKDRAIVLGANVAIAFILMYCGYLAVEVWGENQTVNEVWGEGIYSVPKALLSVSDVLESRSTIWAKIYNIMCTVSSVILFGCYVGSYIGNRDEIASDGSENKKMNKEVKEKVSDEKLFAKKSILGGRFWIITILGVVFCFCIGFWLAGLEGIYEYISFSSGDAWTLASVQITIALLAITVFEVLSGDLGKRVVGISYKRILFHHDFFRINAMDCIGGLFVSILVCIVGGGMGTISGYTLISRCGRWIVVLMTIIALCFVIRLFYFIVLVKYKTSRIFYLIYRRLKEGKKYCIHIEGNVEKYFSFTKQRDYMYRREIEKIEAVWHENKKRAKSK